MARIDALRFGWRPALKAITARLLRAIETPAVVTPRSDAALRLMIVENLISYGGIHPDQVHVTVTEGIVTLWGTVDTSFTHHRVLALTQAVPGVYGVIDLLWVTTTARPASKLSFDDVVLWRSQGRPAAKEGAISGASAVTEYSAVVERPRSDAKALDRAKRDEMHQPCRAVATERADQH